MRRLPRPSTPSPNVSSRRSRGQTSSPAPRPGAGSRLGPTCITRLAASRRDRHAQRMWGHAPHGNVAGNPAHCRAVQVASPASPPARATAPCLRAWRRAPNGGWVHGPGPGHSRKHESANQPSPKQLRGPGTGPCARPPTTYPNAPLKARRAPSTRRPSQFGWHHQRKLRY